MPSVVHRDHNAMLCMMPLPVKCMSKSSPMRLQSTIWDVEQSRMQLGTSMSVVSSNSAGRFIIIVLFVCWFAFLPHRRDPYCTLYSTFVYCILLISTKIACHYYFSPAAS